MPRIINRDNKLNSPFELKGSLGKSFTIDIDGLLLEGDLVYDYAYNIHLLITVPDTICRGDKSFYRILSLCKDNSENLNVNSCFFVPFYVEHSDKSVFSLY
jgi:hypothetical protein